MEINNWLNKPYPFLENLRQKLLLSLSFGFFVYTFLLIFTPFDADKIKENKVLFLAGFGICVFVGMTFTYILMPKLFTKFFEVEKWKIKKEIGFLILNFIVIAILNYTYNAVVGKDIAVYRNFWEFLGITFAIGIFPVVILIFLIERNLNETNTLKAQELSKSLIKEKVLDSKTNEILIITSESIKTDPLKMNLNDFVFAKSDNNYTSIFYEKNNQLNKRLLRLSIKNLEKQLSEFSNIIRCHRSYMVNKQKIKSIEGNARSLLLYLENHNEMIPVSRNFPKEKLV